ncbi:hypothetical protein BDZ94DRAFT_1194298 [Collybia nuda]|uniref:AAA+ ATPase domain-containing protein n=1 Tax=Collybia nuda TaxID=64659 RepID=A0A9P6CJB5_9AGAR|nr:hypothetical protein BDZ94DRAFT_1194298 [Collybia nuda]
MAHAVTQLQKQSSIDNRFRKRGAVRGPPQSTKPLHPLFTKKAHIDSSPVGVVEDLGIIESFDGEIHTTTAVRLSQDRGSQHDPIMVDSSPSKSIPTHSFTEDKRASQVSIPHPFNSGSMLKTSKLKARVAPFPEASAQHTRGPQGTFRSEVQYPRKKHDFHGSGAISRKSPMYVSNWSGAQESFSLSAHTIQTQSVSMPVRGTNLETIPDEHQRFHPAILRVANSFSAKTQLSSSDTPRTSRKSWADKWRPNRAAEVLGNEANALYLRDWLLALELHLNSPSSGAQISSKNGGKEPIQGTKRARIVRSVEKHRGRKKRRIGSDSDDDWIVTSDAEVEEDILQSDDLVDPKLGVNHLPNDYPAYISPHSFNPLTNTILLVGPPGTGKTAAAYACAQELDWEVFEVYPGIGRRSGASIESMVGDVGKNHLVQKSKTRGNDNTTKRHDLSTAKESDDITLSGRDKYFVSQSIDESSHEAINPPPLVRQSLILLEEVDILFRDDTSFWPAVTNFIKNSKRPVICTCNDLSLVPTQDLPLQTIIPFQPCPPPIAVSYLQGLCSSEGYLVGRNSLLQIYDSPNKLGAIDIPNSSNPPLCSEFPTWDLRRTINHLELWCASTNPQAESTSLWEGEHICVEDLSDWAWAISTNKKEPTGFVAGNIPTIGTGIEGLPTHELAVYHADLISFVDSNLMRSVFDTPLALAMRSLEASADDEIGHPILYDPVPTNKGIEFNGRGEEIASTVLKSSRGILEAGTTRRPTSIVKNSFRTHELFGARMSHQLKMAEVMQEFVPPSVWTTARTAVYLDYVSYIRDIVAAEDRDEYIFSQKERPGRSTRNSRGVYERTFAVSGDMREALDSSLLG